MLIVGCLLSPAGVPDGDEMPAMRANAAVTFIRTFKLYLSDIHLANRTSAIHGFLLGWMDTTTSSIPVGDSIVPEPSQGLVPSRMGSISSGSHQYFRLTTRSWRNQLCW
jgi:hypothetical protein